MANVVSAFGYFMRGVFTVGLAINVAVHWMLILALAVATLYGLWLAGNPVLAALVLGAPALLGYRAWSSGR